MLDLLEIQTLEILPRSVDLRGVPSLSCCHSLLASGCDWSPSYPVTHHLTVIAKGVHVLAKPAWQGMALVPQPRIYRRSSKCMENQVTDLMIPKAGAQGGVGLDIGTEDILGMADWDVGS